MEVMNMDLTITYQHGESFSLFYVVDRDAPEPDQPAVLSTYRTRRKAERAMAAHRASHLLDVARKIHDERRKLSMYALGRYGDQGPQVSGCDREHFPDVVKNTLRDLASEWGACIDSSFKLWTKKAGRRRSTWLKLKGDDHRLFAYF